MGAGGIIQQRAAALLPTIMNQSIYPYLSHADQDTIEQIYLKAPDQRTENDVQFLAEKICEVCCT